MATFVLVHGAWSGAHAWRQVRSQLQRAGHQAFTPSLTGVGERVHLAHPLVDLSTHVHDVVNQVVFEDLQEIVLVAHSYGGAVATASLDHLHDRIRELVYLDAFVPHDGETVAQLAGRHRPSFIGLGDDWLLPAPERRYDDPHESEWQHARRVPQPARCFTEPVRLATPLEDHAFGLTYIKATDDGRDAMGGHAFWDAAEHARTSPRWRYHEIATNHMVSVNRPDELTALLLGLAEPAAR